MTNRYDSNVRKTDVLREAIPWIEEHRGTYIVIKYGGAALEDLEIKEDVLQDVLFLRLAGIKTVVVHGGGKNIDRLLQDAGIETRIVNGIRITPKKAIPFVMYGLDEVNKDLVSGMNSGESKLAIGISGIDGGLIIARKLKGEVDYQRTGEVEYVNPQPIEVLIENGYIPIVSPISADAQDTIYNINADDVAMAIAVELGAKKFVLLTDTPGVLENPEDESSLISTIKLDEINSYINSEVISGGMVPKIRACEDAVRGGVEKAHIIDGRVPGSLLSEIFTDQGIGTQILE